MVNSIVFCLMVLQIGFITQYWEVPIRDNGRKYWISITFKSFVFCQMLQQRSSRRLQFILEAILVEQNKVAFLQVNCFLPYYVYFNIHVN